MGKYLNKAKWKKIVLLVIIKFYKCINSFFIKKKKKNYL